MSQTFFVEYHNRGFWAYDSGLSILLKYLIDAGQARMAEPGAAWLVAAVENWRVTVAAHECGKVVDGHWNAEQLAVFIELTNQACAKLAERTAIGSDEVSSWDLGEGIRPYTRGADSVETAPIIELGRAIVALIEGTLLAPPAETAWFFGTPAGRDVIKMTRGFQWDSLD